MHILRVGVSLFLLGFAGPVPCQGRPIDSPPIAELWAQADLVGFFGDFRVICDWRERPEERGGVGRSRLAGSASAPPAHARREPTSLASGVAFLSGFPRG
jgi:hypothetical protein